MATFKNRKISPILLLHFVPPLAALYYIFLFGVNVVFWDQWEIVPLFEKLHNGSLRFTDFFAQHNEHRILFPKIVMLTLGFLTHYNTKAEMMLMLVFAGGTWMLFFNSFRRGLIKQHVFIFFLPVTFLAFNMKQMEGFLVGFNICHSMAQFFSLLALYLISRISHDSKKSVIVMAALCAFVASFSAFPGLLVWPAGLLQLFLMRGAKKTTCALFWSLVCVFTFWLFLFNFNMPASGAYPFRHIGQVFKFMLLLTGNIVYFKPFLVMATGALITLLAGVTLYLGMRETRMNETSFWVASIIFSLLVIFCIAIGRNSRAQTALELRHNALPLRYLIYSLVLLCSVYCLICRLYLTSKMQNIPGACLVILLVVILGSLLFDYAGGITLGQRNFNLKSFLSSVLYNYETQPDDNLRMLYPDPDVVKKHAPVLRKLRYNVFSTP